ncbi:hypothetical protein NUH86_15315 [Sphingobium sp. JS3065]|uniref:hypothetical protein n=1 Tax=Sphingobium sp. JS3065 TaxID=2970925 RepID=UPI0022654064|nr:hypothetical protein [Sphingobium sp. JS3065]UZW54830.1 hypothetical protein NUH86_15315 [Sphingobium sp. JS3065]
MFEDPSNFIRSGFGNGPVDMGILRSLAREFVLSAQTHDMDRQTYLGRLFTEEDLASLPIGHLMDHRIRMPREFALDLKDKDQDEITGLLDHMLCVRPHPEARLLLADALKIETSKLASNLIEMREQNHSLFFDVISGHLDEPLEYLANLHLGSTDLSRAQACIADMLVLYSMFEIQVLAARAVVLDAGKFLPFDHTEMTERAILNLMSDIADAYVYRYRQNHLKVNNLPLIQGRPPVLASKFNLNFARGVAKSKGISKKDQDGNFGTLSDELYQTFGEIKDIIDRAKNDPEFKRPTKEDIENFKSTAASTYFFGISAGTQIAFAALRLINLSKRKRQLTSPNPSHRELAFWEWLKEDLPAKRHNGAKTILFVMRALILEDRQAGTAFDSDGKACHLSSQMNSHDHDGNVAGISLLRDAKRGYPMKSAVNRETVPLDNKLSLAGVHEIDLLPDYRIGLNLKSSTSKERTRKPTVGHDQPPRPKYKLESRSRRSPRAPSRFG